MKAASHRNTFGVFNSFRAGLRRIQGSNTVDWTQVSSGQIKQLADDQFAAAETPEHLVGEYWRQWGDYVKGLDFEF